MSDKEVTRISPAATRSTHERWTVIDRALMEQKIDDANKNARKREIHNLHSSDQEALHRMLNSIQPGSYIRPHRHLDPPKDPDTVLYEVKPGPFTPLTDKDFAPWSPRDNSPDAADFLIELEDEFRRHWNLPPRA
jgi:hypothetical protein